MERFLPPDNERSYFQRIEATKPRRFEAQDPGDSTPLLVIGAGLSGLLTAYYLTHGEVTYGDEERDSSQPPQSPLDPASITILEKESPGGGASGRNGGHIYPDEALPPHARVPWDDDEAFEVRSAFALVRLIEHHGWEEVVELHRSEGVYCTRDSEGGTAHVNGFADGFFASAHRTRNVWQVNGAALCHCLAAHLQACGVSICCGWAATQVRRGESDGWVVHASISKKRQQDVGQQAVGQQAVGERSVYEIHASRVVLALNGFVNEVALPQEISTVTRTISSVRGNVIAFPFPRSGAGLEGDDGAQKLWLPNVVWEDGDGEQYLIHRRDDDRVVVGGCRLAAGGANEVGVLDWRTLHPEVGAAVRDQMRVAGLLAWDGDIECEWSGIMGFTEDHLPIVCAPLAGCFVIGGFTGHGMPRVCSAARHLARLLLEEDLSDR